MGNMAFYCYGDDRRTRMMWRLNHQVHESPRDRVFDEMWFWLRQEVNNQVGIQVNDLVNPQVGMIRPVLFIKDLVQFGALNAGAP